jgi:hypothetical protein
MMRRTALNPKRKTPRRKGTPTPRIKAGRVEDPEHLARVRSLPCLICGRTPSEAHHIRDGVGVGQKAGDDEAINLCPMHHRLGGFGVAFHHAPREFQAKFGTERELLARTLEMLKSQEAA